MHGNFSQLIGNVIPAGARATSLVLVACLSGPAQAQSPAFADESLVAPPVDGWPTNGGNWYNQRYSPLDQIARENVAQLKGVWRARLDGSGVGPQYSGEAQPIVHDGVIYIVTGASDVFAIDVESGNRLWKHEAGLSPDIGGIVCCGWTSRGVGLGEGKIFLGQLDGKLVALDEATGEVAWSVQAALPEDGLSITGAPLYYDGLVITGFAGAEYGVRGRVQAYAARDGALVWTFYTIPGPGELGHDTWPADNEVWMHGGATVWQTPALDPELGLIYFSTGNPGPDFDGSVRAGDNLFSTSIVALDVRDGEHAWHFQQVHHDLWDYDGPNPVVLFDIDIDGRTRKGLAQASKTGWVYILDRTNGEPLIGIDERPVPQEPRQLTAATQPYPVGDAFVPQSIEIAPEGSRLINGGRIFTPFWTDETVVLRPGPLGGANWPPSAYDPESGHLFVCASDRLGYFRAEPETTSPAPGQRYTGGPLGGSPLPRTGIYAAMDMRTNRIVWRQQWYENCYSGSTVTAGGIVFIGRNDGRLTALDTSNGHKLWEFQTGAGMNAPVSVFEHGGTQYVTAYSAGNLFAGSAKGDSLWLFSLDGTIEPVDPAGTLLTFSGEVAEGPADLDAGQEVYETACTFCHGEEALGGHGGGPTLADVGSNARIIQVVSEGLGDMPAFAGALSPEQIRDVSAFIIERLLPRAEQE